MHLLKPDHKELASAGLKLQRPKLQKNGKFKNLKVDTNLCDEEQAQTEVNTGYSRQGTLVLSNNVKEIKVPKSVVNVPDRNSGDWVC